MTRNEDNDDKLRTAVAFLALVSVLVMPEARTREALDALLGATLPPMTDDEYTGGDDEDDGGSYHKQLDRVAPIQTLIPLPATLAGLSVLDLRRYRIELLTYPTSVRLRILEQHGPGSEPFPHAIQVVGIPRSDEQCSQCHAWFAPGHLCSRHRLCGHCHQTDNHNIVIRISKPASDQIVMVAQEENGIPLVVGAVDKHTTLYVRDAIVTAIEGALNSLGGEVKDAAE